MIEGNSGIFLVGSFPWITFIQLRHGQHSQDTSLTDQQSLCRKRLVKAKVTIDKILPGL